MSVINQMLLDLEARARQAGDELSPQDSARQAAPAEVRAAAAPKPPARRLPWLLAALVLALVLAAAWAGWQRWQEQAMKPAELPPGLSLRISDALLAVPAVPTPGASAGADGVLAEPSGAAGALHSGATEVQTGPQSGPSPSLPSTSVPSPGSQAQAAAGPTVASALPPVSPPARYPPAQALAAPAAPAGRFPPATPQPGEAAGAAPAAGHYPPAIPSSKPREAALARERLAAPPELTPRQQAEAELRRGQELQRGARLNDAIAAYEHALELDRSLASARQSLAAGLIEAKRVDEAMTRLQEGLDENRANGSLAMMLARLQLERGDARAAIDTLGRSLPYDRERADYQAFMAGLLQKEGRHKEAIDYYLTALRRAPQNSAWWMGLGLSLQAEKRNGEAREALQRALALGGLSADLQSFVQQRLEQMR